MAFGNHRFLVNNIARTAYLASPSGVQASTIESGRIGGIQKIGTGSAVWKAAGEFTGQEDLLVRVKLMLSEPEKSGAAPFDGEPVKRHLGIGRHLVLQQTRIILH